jgi:hypothetical protein
MPPLLRCRWVPVLLAFASVAPVSGADQDVAYVLQVSGPWVVSRDPSRTLHSGQGLQAGDSLSLQRPPRQSDLVVILGREDNRIVAKRRCAVEDCVSPVSIPQGLGAVESLPSRVLRSVMARWSREGSARFSGMEARNGVNVLYEGVVAVGGAETELLPIVGDLPPGSYTLTWEPVVVEGREIPPAPPSTRLEIGPGRPTAIQQMILPPGLYAVRAFRGAEGAGAVPLADAWVLAVNACADPGASRSFAEAVAVSATWAPEVSGDTVRRFLRARLFDLASTLPPCPG